MKNLVMVKYLGNNIFCDTNNLSISKDTYVIIDTPNGLGIGITNTTSLSFDEKKVPKNISNIIRIATSKDIEQNKKNIEDAANSIEKVNKFKNDLGLSMKIIDSFYTFDRTQLVFLFTADGRVDFRELAKKLAQVYKTRIELRQIGVRDNAKRIGGIGPCGRFLCCSTFLTDFDSVSINMAKNQFIALNPSKINGVCGRLLCCLKYEDDQYTDLKKQMPRVGQTITVNGVSGRVSSINLFLNTAVLETKAKVYVEVNLGDKDGSTK